MGQQRYVNSVPDFRQVNASGDWRIVNALDVVNADYPITPKWREASISTFAPTYVSVTNSLRRQARSRGAQAWQVTLRYGAMKRATFAPLWAFLTRQGGQAGTFTVNLPEFAPRGAATGTPRVNGSGQTGTSLVTDGWSNNTLILREGDFIQVEPATKVYQVTADVTSNGSGAATIPIYPALRSSPGDNAAVTPNPLFLMALTGDTVEVGWDQCVIVPDFEVSLVEVV